LLFAHGDAPQPATNYTDQVSNDYTNLEAKEYIVVRVDFRAVLQPNLRRQRTRSLCLPYPWKEWGLQREETPLCSHYSVPPLPNFAGSVRLTHLSPILSESVIA